MKRKLLILSLLAIALTACTEETVLPSAQQQASSRSVAENIRVVPLRIYMGKKTNSRTADVAPTFSTSYGEKTHLEDGMGTSVARNLTFYVYARTANSNGDFLYDETKSSALNAAAAEGLKEKTFFRDFDETTFYTAQVSFEKEQGKEYKILVTASGAEQETGTVGTITTTNPQSANALTYMTGNTNQIKNGDKLSELKAKVVNEAVYIPERRGGGISSSASTIEYETDPVDFYGLQEGFYGFCESRSATNGDKNIITYEDPSALRAYLVRNVARVEFKFTNIRYENDSYSFPWIGIYATHVGTESDAYKYDCFRARSTNPIIDEEYGTLVAYYDEKGMGHNTMNDGFGTANCTSGTPGSYSFVTYMLPTTTYFKFRSEWNEQPNIGIKYKYCYKINIPIEDTGGIGGYDEEGTAIPVTTPFDGSNLKIECNRNYIITVDCSKRLVHYNNDY